MIVQDMDSKKSFPALKFPKDFYWGASTAAHQVEGGNHNQWTVWELAHASQQAKDIEGANNPFALRRSALPVWNDIKSAVADPENYVSGSGVEHFVRYKDDFKLLSELNLNAFRFSIEWSRIEPKMGEWNNEAIEHYRNYIAELKKHNIEPFLNLWHWTNPVWFEELGGFEKRSNLTYFKRFVQKICDEFGSDLTNVLTINEANNYMSLGYILGVWPPGHKNALRGLRVYYNLVLAHRQAYKVFKASYPDIQIGVAHQAVLSKPKHRGNVVEKIVAKVANYVWYEWFFDRCIKYQDFVGVNFYQVNYISWFSVSNPTTPVSDLGWYLEPQALMPVLIGLSQRYDKPIFITENGVADMHDTYRKQWLEQTLMAIDGAITSGVDVRGYFHWSLLDNFEWAEGWWPRFGLVEVDRMHNMKRTIRPSARWFASVIMKSK